MVNKAKTAQQKKFTLIIVILIIIVHSVGLYNTLPMFHEFYVLDKASNGKKRHEFFCSNPQSNDFDAGTQCCWLPCWATSPRRFAEEM